MPRVARKADHTPAFSHALLALRLRISASMPSIELCKEVVDALIVVPSPRKSAESIVDFVCSSRKVVCDPSSIGRKLCSVVSALASLSCCLA
ncbi:MAG: hypothetical protein SPL79_11790 [Sphaerochaetaceae bacterium]|nr:hypothetical protein [Sphaerochaetaceae bacterium]